MSDCARELYPEEKALIKFLKKVWGEDVVEKGYGVSEENDKKLGQLHTLFSEMESTGARKEVRELQTKLGNAKRSLQRLCTRIPIEELLTDQEDDIREIGLEFQEIIDYHGKSSSELVEGITTFQEFIDRCEEWKKANK